MLPVMFLTGQTSSLADSWGGISWRDMCFMAVCSCQPNFFLVQNLFSWTSVPRKDLKVVQSFSGMWFPSVARSTFARFVSSASHALLSFSTRWCCFPPFLSFFFFFKRDYFCKLLRWRDFFFLVNLNRLWLQWRVNSALHNGEMLNFLFA